MIPELELELSKKINKYNCKNIIQKYIYTHLNLDLNHELSKKIPSFSRVNFILCLCFFNRTSRTRAPFHEEGLTLLYSLGRDSLLTNEKKKKRQDIWNYFLLPRRLSHPKIFCFRYSRYVPSRK